MTTELIGDWDVRIKTPVGSLQVVYRFLDEAGTVVGTADGKAETVPLTDIVITDSLDGQRIQWRQSVTKPMRLNLEFDVLVQGDRMSGHSRAGRLPRSAVSGLRRR
ncbi:hypothetical protein SAMN04489835_3945 [Mycolicibacterium rutilum]|uniref:Uncharacterized protein n=1 Tax=Mycolicibacterium rutilum TaxID=370526 RepID=A0A1H6KZK0_MYCRU|nr:hypothetical protein [Mycolicibacterium rutilum]SEH77232.1 hypothetical protein SAMN04489835_3945 [Mycolicibacterium rutilum]